MITKDIPIIDNAFLDKEIRQILRDIAMQNNWHNAYYMLGLVEPSMEKYYDEDMITLTKFFREKGIKSDSVMIDNTW